MIKNMSKIYSKNKQIKKCPLSYKPIFYEKECVCISAVYARDIWKYTCYFINWKCKCTETEQFNLLYIISTHFKNFILKRESLNDFHYEKMRQHFSNMDKSYKVIHKKIMWKMFIDMEIC